ncbi:hypothetical protein BH09MYX1_BH09MYX1_06350 [soil metagenome]
MKRAQIKSTKLSLLLVTLFAVGCASTQKPNAVAQTPLRPTTALAPIAFDSIDDDAYGPAASATAPASPGKNPGDFVVTEIAQAGRKTPLLLTQRVIARDGQSMFVEYELKDGTKIDTFRVRTEGEQVAEVTKVVNGVEHASTAAAYDTMMARTVPNVTRNDGVTDSEPAEVSFGGKTAAATRMSYKIAVAGKPATMTVTQSDKFAWGDVEGEITDAAGKMVYHARVVESGSGTGDKTSVAINVR